MAGPLNFPLRPCQTTQRIALQLALANIPRLRHSKKECSQALNLFGALRPALPASARVARYAVQTVAGC